MSRSFKHKPFQSVCGGSSAKQDKVLAHRGERRKQNQELYQAFLTDDWEDFLLPHKLECTHNEVYTWGRDGHQTYQAPDDYDKFMQYRSIFDESYYAYGDPECTQWPPAWYKEMMRK